MEKYTKAQALYFFLYLILPGAWWISGRFGALHPQGHRFESYSSHHVGTLGKSFTQSCLYNEMWCPAWLAVKFDTCNNLLSSIHTLLVSILQYVRLYIKRKIYIMITISSRWPLTDLNQFGTLPFQQRTCFIKCFCYSAKNSFTSPAFS